MRADAREIGVKFETIIGFMSTFGDMRLWNI